MALLLTRDEFRTHVLRRDVRACVVCRYPAADAHHIMDRRLFPHGGYYVDNGVSLCAVCHLKAEATLISCEALRKAAAIDNVVLPPHLEAGTTYDRWGNPILPNKTRLRGELFLDGPVQKALEPVLGLFTNRVKYPRTYHLPWSSGATDDDKVLEDDSAFHNERVVVTLKMDGENTTFYSDGMHARSLEYEPHASRNLIRALHARVRGDIPENWRVCGENLYAKHSIGYDALAGYFLLFSVWNDQNVCLSWDDTLEWAELLDLPTVPVIFTGCYDRERIEADFAPHRSSHEGYVVRCSCSFPYRNFRHCVTKYVRASHVQTSEHWKNQIVVPNRLAKGR